MTLYMLKHRWDRTQSSLFAKSKNENFSIIFSRLSTT